MDIQDLQLFITVVRLGSISAAARQTSLSQPSASRRIRHLERELGVELLDRSRAVATPTREGLEFLQFAERVIQQYEALQRHFSTTSPPFHMSLNIAASTTPGEYWLPTILPPFQADNPHIQISLCVMPSAAVETCVVERRCDLGFIGRPPNHSHLRHWVVAEDEIVLAVSSSHAFAGREKVSLGELNGQPFVCRSSGSATHEVIVAKLAELGFHLSRQRLALEVTSVPAQLNAIAAGQGIGFVSRMALAGPGQSRVVPVPIAEVKLKRKLYMIQDPE
ncbi:MAG TPA: LysR family transcriptional regulator, partial [Firmicutes bacterium]|nr:LysR family transcriptional regulator [Bacillota bacterium]